MFNSPLYIYSSVSKTISIICNGRLIRDWVGLSTMHGTMDLNGRYYI